MRRYCKDTNWSESSGSRVECGDVTIFSQDYFYPINWRQWFWLYKVSILTIYKKFRQDFYYLS